MKIRGTPTPKAQNPKNSEPEVFEPFDPKAFDQKVEQAAKQSYLEANDITRFFAAQDVGWGTKCQHIDQALAYWDYLVMRAHKAFEAKFGFPYEEAEGHLKDDKSCPYYSVDNMARQKGIDFWRMLLDLRRVVNNAEALSQMALKDWDWKATTVAPYDNVYSLGVTAAQKGAN